VSALVARPSRHPLPPPSGLLLSYYEPIKKTDYPSQTAKGHLPLWMVSKVEADVTSLLPQVSLFYRDECFTFKGVLRVLLKACHFLPPALISLCSPKALPRCSARFHHSRTPYSLQPHNRISLTFAQELLRRSDLAQKNSLMTGAPPPESQLKTQCNICTPLHTPTIPCRVPCRFQVACCSGLVDDHDCRLTCDLWPAARACHDLPFILPQAWRNASNQKFMTAREETLLRLDN